MIKDEARQIALAHVKAMEREAQLELVILDAHTIERSYGWVFFYDSQRHVQSGDFRDSIAGNAPILITKADGKIHETGTAMPIEHYLKKFDAEYGEDSTN